VQGSAGGWHCYINLGAHLAFLSTDGGAVCNPRRIKEYECAFRDRLEPAAGQSIGWNYGSTVDDMHTSLALLLERWSTDGHRFFAKHRSSDDFLKLVERAVIDPAHPIDSLKLARIGANLGREDLSLSIAENALPRVAPAATRLRAELQGIIDRRGKA
jgi:hypothetical protein